MVEARPRSTVEAGVQPLRRRPEKQLPYPLSIYQSAVGKKWTMAVTGVIGMAFITMHMVGNLKIYLGAEELNAYADGLRTVGAPFAPHGFLLWGVRLVLLPTLLLHVHAAWWLWRQNRRARPVKYQSKRDYIAADWASRTMTWTGPIVLLFVVFHLLDLTWGTANPDFHHGDVYHNMLASFDRWPIVVAYVAANLALGVHLYHGAWSLFQSLGVNNARINTARRVFATLFAVAIVGGYVSTPIAILIGVIE